MLLLDRDRAPLCRRRLRLDDAREDVLVLAPHEVPRHLAGLRGWALIFLDLVEQLLVRQSVVAAVVTAGHVGDELRVLLREQLALRPRRDAERAPLRLVLARVGLEGLVGDPDDAGERLHAHRRRRAPARLRVPLVHGLGHVSAFSPTPQFW